MGSKIDWRDMEDVSVLLPLSPNIPEAGCAYAGGVVGFFCGKAAALPVIRSRLNASTSIEALEPLDEGCTDALFDSSGSVAFICFLWPPSRSSRVV